MSKPTYELAKIIKEHRLSFTDKHTPLKHHLRVLNALENCRTAHLGGHVDCCDDCGYKRISYNSCRNRHCPKCQNTTRERWIMARENDLLPVTYFHVVFTLPSELNTYCLKFPAEMYAMLFESSKETMIQFGKDPKHLGAELGFISLLHTWGQNLSLHPHVHLIVPGGGLNKAGYWVNAKNKGNYLFPVKQLSLVYRGKFMEKFTRLCKEKNIPLPKEIKEGLYTKNWVVYAKQPFGGPKQVVEYLARYSHKIAISNHRIKKVDQGSVTFCYKDYADGNKQKLMTLEALEFLRRFCLHILPPKFMKIRNYGFLSSRAKFKLKKHQMLLGIPLAKKEKKGWKELTKSNLGFDVEACPCCITGRMKRIVSFDPNAPPQFFLPTPFLIPIS